MLFQTISYDKNGEEVDAATAARGEDFFCPSCKGPMILRRGKINIAHFAHKKLTPNCKPETVLHLLGKDKVKEVVESYIERSEPLKSNFHCSHCGSVHDKNILDGVESVQLEKALDFARPDVSLTNEDDITTTVVEVVVTHKPEEEVLRLFLQKDVFYIRVNLKEYTDLEKIETILKKPSWDRKENYSTNQFCTIKDNPELFCSKHGWAKDKRLLYIIDYPCKSCHQYTKVAALNLERSNPYSGELPDSFSDVEIQVSKKEGVYLDKHKFSRKPNGYYWLVNKCSNCKSLPYFSAGDRRMDVVHEYSEWYDKHPDRVKVIETGYSCGECEWENSSSE